MELTKVKGELEMEQIEFFHCSPVKFKAGDVLVPRNEFHEMNFTISAEYEQGGIFLHTNHVPHFTLWWAIFYNYVRRIKRTKLIPWYVYKVSPIGKLRRGRYYDIICDTAKIIDKIGSARKILRSYKKEQGISQNTVSGYFSNKDHVDENMWNKLMGCN